MMARQKTNLKKFKVSNKGYGDLDGSEFFLTEDLFKKLESRKSRSGQSFIELLEQGRAVRGFKHLLETIKSRNKAARLILTDQKTRKSGNDYYINLNNYSNKGHNRFLAFYRSTALEVSSIFLAEQFPGDFPAPKDSMSNQEISKTGKNFDQVLNELTQKRKHKKQMLRKTSELVKDLQSEKQNLKRDITELEELKRQSTIAFYIARLDELRLRFGKPYKETSGKNSWQSWIYANNWIMGIQYLPPIEKQKVGFDNIPDYLLPTLDGFIDILEIKLPSHEVIKPDPSHAGSYSWSPETNKAIGQVVNYLYEMELHQLELQKKITRKYKEYKDQLGSEVTIIKPRAFILIGLEDDWDDDMKEAFRKLNHTLHGIEVITYTDLLNRGEYIINLYSKKGNS